MKQVYEQIKEDLEKRGTKLQKPHIKSVASLVSSLLVSRSPNLMVIGELLNREIKDTQDRYQYVRRFLKNELVDVADTMRGYTEELVKKLSETGVVVLAIDQSKVTDGLECLMVSVRVGGRGLPLLWRVKETEGPIGFEVQKQLLEGVARLIPAGVEVILMGDRFYGTSSLVGFCQSKGWGYRIRLKSNLNFIHQEGLVASGDFLKMGLPHVEQATFKGTSITTNIGSIHEPGHPEPWIIAMNCKPTQYTTLDYGLRWGIEAMFSDFKSRGFSITDTHLKHPDRIERLILLIAIALFWTVSTGMAIDADLPPRSKKNQDPLFHFLPEASALS